MVKLIKYVIVFSIFISTLFAYAEGNAVVPDVMESIKITDADIPEGFMYGQIPAYARDLFKGNPWHFDKPAITRLTKSIYPGGDCKAVQDIHVTIMTKKNHPQGDDLVVFMILYKDAVSAGTEIKKLNEYVGYNRDRAIVIVKDNLAVFIHVNDTRNVKYMQSVAQIIESRIKNK